MFFHHHFYHAVEQSGTSSSFWGGFWGAFFAFLFGFLTYIITKRRERFIQHKNALVNLERILNKHLDDLAVLQTIALDGERILGQGKVTSNRLFKLKLPDNLDMEIGSVEIINKFFSYRQSIERLNFNSDITNHALAGIEDLFIHGQPVLAQNFSFIAGTLKSFSDDIPHLSKKTKNFLVLIRIHYRKLKDENSFIYGVLNTHWEQLISQQEIKYEHEKLAKEIEQIQKETKEDFF
jgi:hypothetical protein